MYQKDDVVFLPFPFTDLTAFKTRPSVVVSVADFERDSGDFTVSMTTSIPHATAYAYELQDWRKASPLRPLWVFDNINLIEMLLCVG